MKLKFRRYKYRKQGIYEMLSENNKEMFTAYYMLVRRFEFNYWQAIKSYLIASFMILISILTITSCLLFLAITVDSEVLVIASVDLILNTISIFFISDCIGVLCIHCALQLFYRQQLNMQFGNFKQRLNDINRLINEGKI